MSWRDLRERRRQTLKKSDIFSARKICAYSFSLHLVRPRMAAASDESAAASDERWGEVEGLRYETQSSATLVVKTRTDGVGNHAQVSPALPRHCPVAACLQRGQGGLAGLMADGGAC